MPKTITLYKAELKNVCAPVDSGLWSFTPKEQRLGEEPESADFILPDDFDVNKTMFGTFIVVAGTKDMCHLTFTATGEPLVTDPKGKMTVLERA